MLETNLLGSGSRNKALQTGHWYLTSEKMLKIYGNIQRRNGVSNDAII